MKQSYEFTVSGMTCHACAELITLDLADVQLSPQSIDVATGQLKIELETEQIATAQRAIEQSGKYSVTAVKPL